MSLALCVCVRVYVCVRREVGVKYSYLKAGPQLHAKPRRPTHTHTHTHRHSLMWQCISKKLESCKSTLTDTSLDLSRKAIIMDGTLMMMMMIDDGFGRNNSICRLLAIFLAS